MNPVPPPTTERRHPETSCGYPALVAVALAAALLSACHRGPVAIDNPLGIHHDEYDAVFEATEAVLREYRFEIDRADRRFGVVTSRPMTASSLIEPWYADNTTFDQVLDSSINHHRRTVRVELEPATDDQGDASAGQAMPIQPGVRTDYLLRVEVYVDRRHVAERQLNTAAVTGVGFAQNTGRTRSLATERGLQTEFWRPIGRDAALEQRLVRAIVQRATLPVESVPGSHSSSRPGQGTISPGVAY